jgi:hypothetical protein
VCVLRKRRESENALPLLGRCRFFWHGRLFRSNVLLCKVSLHLGMLNWNHERCDCLRHSKVELQERLELRRAKFHVVVRAYKREPNSHDEFTELKVHAFEEDVSANSACRAKLSKISDTIRCITRSERICSQAQLTERKVHSRCRHHEPCANGFDPKNIGPCSISWLNRFRRLTS